MQCAFERKKSLNIIPTLYFFCFTGKPLDQFRSKNIYLATKLHSLQQNDTFEFPEKRTKEIEVTCSDTETQIVQLESMSARCMVFEERIKDIKPRTEDKRRFGNQEIKKTLYELRI